MEIDRTLLAKLLSMTDSSHDAEALAAIRKANQMLRFQEMTWSDVLVRTPRLEAPGPSIAEVEPPPSPPPLRERPAGLPLGYQSAEQYRDSFRRESIVLRLLAFPFWFLVEFLAGMAPDMILKTRGRLLSLAFTACMLLSVAAWGAFAYFLLFEFN